LGYENKLSLPPEWAAMKGPDAAGRAAVAWNRLSNACHVHAYEMQPFVVEIEYLCAAVAALLPVEAATPGAAKLSADWQPVPVAFG
jgi:hypothetical protein